MVNSVDMWRNKTSSCAAEVSVAPAMMAVEPLSTEPKRAACAAGAVKGDATNNRSSIVSLALRAKASARSMYCACVMVWI